MVQNKELVKVEESKVKSWEEALEKQSWFAPLVDIYETENDYVLIANMPGVSKDNVKIKLEEGNLVIMGRVNYEDMINRQYVLNESELGNYYRKFKLSDSIDESKIEAKFENGQLSVMLTKHDRVKPRTIDIN